MNEVHHKKQNRFSLLSNRSSGGPEARIFDRWSRKRQHCLLFPRLNLGRQGKSFPSKIQVLLFSKPPSAWYPGKVRPQRPVVPLLPGADGRWRDEKKCWQLTPSRVNEQQYTQATITIHSGLNGSLSLHGGHQEAAGV